MIFFGWSLVASACTWLAGKVARAAGFDEAGWWVRCKVVLPEAAGTLAALVAIPLLCERLDWLTLAQLPWLARILIYPFAGIGAGAVSSKGWKFWRQSLLGDDRRIPPQS